MHEDNDFTFTISPPQPLKDLETRLSTTILAAGSSGSGKTYSICRLLQSMQFFKPDSHTLKANTKDEDGFKFFAVVLLNGMNSRRSLEKDQTENVEILKRLSRRYFYEKTFNCKENPIAFIENASQVVNHFVSLRANEYPSHQAAEDNSILVFMDDLDPCFSNLSKNNILQQFISVDCHHKNVTFVVLSQNPFTSNMSLFWNLTRQTFVFTKSAAWNQALRYKSAIFGLKPNIIKKALTEISKKYPKFEIFILIFSQVSRQFGRCNFKALNKQLDQFIDVDIDFFIGTEAQ